MRSMASRIKRSFSPSGALFLQTRPKKTQPRTPAFCSVDMSASLGSSALYLVETIDASTVCIHIILYMFINPLDQMLTCSYEKCSLNISYDKLSKSYLKSLKMRNIKTLLNNILTYAYILFNKY